MIGAARKGGYCCRKGYHDTSHGCDGSFGGDGIHACALKLCGLDPSPNEAMYKHCVSDPITGFK